MQLLGERFEGATVLLAEGDPLYRIAALLFRLGYRTTHRFKNLHHISKTQISFISKALHILQIIKIITYNR